MFHVLSSALTVVLPRLLFSPLLHPHHLSGSVSMSVRMSFHYSFCPRGLPASSFPPVSRNTAKPMRFVSSVPSELPRKLLGYYSCLPSFALFPSPVCLTHLSVLIYVLLKA